MAGETCIDFDFSDILSKIEDKPVTKHNNGSFNVNYFNLETNFNLDFSFERDSSDEDLTALLDSNQSQNHDSSDLISLAALAKDHFSNTLSSLLTSDSDEGIQDSFLLNLKKNCTDESGSADCLQDILLGGNYEEQGKNANHKDVLNFLNLKSSNDVKVDNYVQKEKFLPEEDELDDGLIQDIDLSFCIKKNKNKAEITPGSSSFDSKDSGFYDIDSSFSLYNSSSSDEIISSENLKSNDHTKFPLSTAKQSLFSRSIAAKPQIDKSRKRKLNMVKRELLKKNITLPSELEREQKMKKYLSVIDQSNQSVMTSSFFTIPDLK